MIVTVDVYPEPRDVERAVWVQLSASRQVNDPGTNLQIGTVNFRSLTDDQLQQIIETIELYRMRKNVRLRKRAQQQPAAEDPDAKV